MNNNVQASRYSSLDLGAEPGGWEKQGELSRNGADQGSTTSELSTLNSSMFNSIHEETFMSTTRQEPYNSDIPSGAPFWVEIRPPPDLQRDLYMRNEEEFNVVGIFGDVGEGDNTLYEVQFEDDHTATVAISFSPTDYSCL